MSGIEVSASARLTRRFLTTRYSPPDFFNWLRRLVMAFTFNPVKSVR